jgi:hypothetical protein
MRKLLLFFKKKRKIKNVQTANFQRFDYGVHHTDYVMDDMLMMIRKNCTEKIQQKKKYKKQESKKKREKYISFSESF